jgi:hypothetical protein
MSNINTVQEKLFSPASTCTQDLNVNNWKMLGVHLRYIFYQIRTFTKPNIRLLLLRCVCVYQMKIF